MGMTITANAKNWTDSTMATPLALESALTGARTTIIDPRRWQKAKVSYTTRHVACELADRPRELFLVTGDGVVPRPGDVALARVAEIGQHTRLESPASRRQLLFPGDEIVVAYGHRYAPDQYEAYVPGDLGLTNLIAAGGVIGTVTAQHTTMAPATTVQPLGLLADGQGLLTLGRCAPLAVREEAPPAGNAPVLAVLGTSMNAGKSLAVACLVRGLTAAGLTVAAGKATGTGAGGDPRLFTDAGATRVLDFTDFGLPSTYRLNHSTARRLLGSLVAELSGPGVDVTVVEVADGVYQDETARLLADPLFGTLIDGVVFAAADALGAVAGVSVLREAGVDVRAVSGLLTAAPLGAREAAAQLDVPVIDTYDLCDPDVARSLPR